MSTLVRSRRLAVVVALAAAGCGDDVTVTQPASDAGDLRIEAIVAGTPSLLQTVTLTPGVPAAGDTVTITSTIRNRGPSPVAVEIRLCGLTLGGSLKLQDVGGRCGAFSMRRTLAVGDSVSEIERKVVVSPRGTYILEVQHLLSPATTASTTVVVR